MAVIIKVVGKRKKPSSATTSQFSIFRSAFVNQRSGSIIQASRAWREIKDRARSLGYDDSRLSVRVVRSGGNSGLVEISAPGNRGLKKVMNVTLKNNIYTIRNFGALSKPKRRKSGQRDIFMSYFFDRKGGGVKDASEVWRASIDQIKKAGYDERTASVSASGDNIFFLVQGSRGPKKVLTVKVKQ
jgi:hypothetical protein